MSLLVASGVDKAFAGDQILSEVSFRLEWGQKLGLVGRNGAGKTTLLRILTGQMEPDKGRVTLEKGIRFGYLRQEQMVENGWTVFKEAEDAFAPVLQMEQRLRDLEQLMGDHHDSDRLADVMDEYSLMRDRFDAMGGYTNVRDIQDVLKRLGFAASDMDKPTARLSGGEKTRLGLAKLLLSSPDILLLDEPTNHLDLQATEWLEEFLKEFGGAVILVSHDRVFLDNTVTVTAELDHARLTVYTGNFSAFWKQRQERRLRQAEQFERDQREVQRLNEFFEKWKNTPSKRSQAVMRKRWADRIQSEMVERPTTDGRAMKSALKSSVRSGNEVVIIEHLTKKFGTRVLIDDVTLMIERGMRVGIVGPNGAGKTTLIRMLMGLEEATDGSIRFGANVTHGYFAQEASELDLEATVLENMMDVAEMLPTEARTHLGKFLFTGDDVFRRTAELSGGEKNKLALAQLTYLRPNLLILDEPTNHLDMDSREALVEMIKGYDGTLLLVSHDRYLLDQVTNHTLEVAGGKVRLYDDPYSLYRQAKARQELREKSQAANQAKAPSNGSSSATTGMNSHQLSKERAKAVKLVQAAEKRVGEMEDWQKRIEEALSAPLPGDDILKLSKDYESAQNELTKAMTEWESALTYAEEIGAKG